MYNRRANDSRSYFIVFFAFLAGARTYCVCLFISFSLLIASHLSLFLSPIQTHALNLTTNDNGVHIYTYIHMWANRFLVDFLSCFFFFFFFLFLLYYLIKIHIHTIRTDERKETALCRK